MLETNKIHNYNCLEGLKLLDDNSVDCCITSPPYWGLRDYGTATWVGGDPNCKHIDDVKLAERKRQRKSMIAVGEKIDGSTRIREHDELIGKEWQYSEKCKKCGAIRKDEQLGLEKTPEEYVSNMIAIFSEVNRVLKTEGTLWLNLGDSYYGSNSNDKSITNKKSISAGMGQGKSYRTKATGIVSGLKPKDMVGIPWMTAFALRSDGWYLRQDIIWHKPNPMPESVTDRCTKSHEYIFLMAKSQKYYFDHEAIQEEAVTNIPNTQGDRGSQGYAKASGVNGSAQRSNSGGYGYSGHKSSCTPGQTPQSKALKRMEGIKDDNYETRNKRDVWTVNTKPYKEAHFATFPERLIVDMIKAGCPKDGIVLDPFMGAGTTAVVARKLNRNFIGFELNKDYITIADKRLYEELGMYL